MQRMIRVLLPALVLVLGGAGVAAAPGPAALSQAGRRAILRAMSDGPSPPAAFVRKIPAGETWTYGRLAAHIGRPEAVRAAGLANGANPISVVVPCHRVIGADGGLTGYGGGLDRKKWLLGHEGARFKEARGS